MKNQHNKKHELLKTAILVGVTAAAMPFAAHAGGLDNIKSGADNILSELKIIIPVVASIAGLGVFAGYSAKFVQKEDAVRWGIGIAGCGSVGTLVALLYGNG